MLKSKLRYLFFRFFINLWPGIRRTGGRVVALSPDYTQLTVRIKLNWSTYNYVGTVFGGSIYASTDPMYMLMLMNILGPDYIVWDKAASIRFKRPSKTTMFCHFHITPEMLKDVRDNVAAKGEYVFTWPAAFKDADGLVYTEFDKTLYVATKAFYKEKQRQRTVKA